jgi:hypothetical protein
MKAKGLVLLIILLAAVNASAQRIYYSEPDRDDVRQLRFEILGKYNNQYLIYKNNRNRHQIAIYEPDMKLKEKVDLDFIPDRSSGIEVFSNPENSILFYQYQKKNIVYFMGVQIDGNGKKIGEPLELDTTRLSVFGDSKVYSVIASDDKKKYMVFKMRNLKNDDLHVQTLLLSNTLIPIRRTSFIYFLDNNKESIADFYLDNEGNFLFSHVARPGQREYISKAKLSVLKTYADTVQSYSLTLKDVFLDELRIKVDNTNGRYILSSLYSKSKRGNIDGLFLAIVNKDLSGADIERAIEFTDEFREQAKGENNTKMAFNDYYLKHFIVKRDGGILITGESAYTNSRGSNWNRWNNPWGMGWGNPWNNYWGWNSWNNWGFNGWGWGGSPWGFNNFGTANQQTRYYADNIMILALDKDGSLQWNNIVNKSQFDDNSDNMLSYQYMNTGGEILFLYNEWARRMPMLNAQSLTPDGKIKKEPPLKSLDKGYEFMIRLGKQVGVREMMVPVLYRNMFSFARIEF